MSTTSRHDSWQAGESYDAYMGRWSRSIAKPFLDWLAIPSGLEWLEVGCGTGALTHAIISQCRPASVIAIEPSAGFIGRAAEAVGDLRVEFRLGDADSLNSIAANSRDLAVAGLVLNFIPDRVKALQDLKRIVRPGGIVGFYVWDYPGGGVEFMRAFWTAAVTLDLAAADLTEDKRFPFCTPDGLIEIAQEAGLETAEITAIEVPSIFRDFDDYWRPFTLGAGPAPGYCASLPADRREQLKEELSTILPRQADGSIALRLRAWAVKAFLT